VRKVRLVFEHESTIAAPAQAVFAFHERPDALQLLIPPGQPIKIIEHTGGIRDGARVVLQMGFWPFAICWVARHKGYVPGRQFQDVQEKGPFRFWEHTHIVIPVTEHSCILRDHIEYELPFGKLGQSGNAFVRKRLVDTFLYRHRMTTRQTMA
jgi:ligand-binding SRPBCC domain-containing protein